MPSATSKAQRLPPSIFQRSSKEPGLGAEPASDRRFNGFFIGTDSLTGPYSMDPRQLRPVRPNNGKAATETVFFVNGIMTDVALQRENMQSLANTGLNVIGIHNATDGLFSDLGECILDKIGLGTNPAVDSAALVLVDALTKDKPISMIGHSQGALIVARALDQAKNFMLLEGKFAPAEVEERLKRVRVETYGGAGARWVDGPQYLHMVNKYDAVPMTSGVELPFFAKPGSGRAS